MYGYLELTSTFAPVGWLIVALTASAIATLYAQRERTAIEQSSPARIERRLEEQTERWAA